VAVLAFAAGSVTSLFTLPFWVVAATNAAKAGSRTDWLGFSGSVIAGFMTLVAATAAWFAVKQQIDAQENSYAIEKAFRDETIARRQAEAKEAARIVLSQVIHAAATIAHINTRMLNAINKEYANAAEQTGAIGLLAMLEDLLKSAVSQLKMTLSYFAVAEAWRDLSIEDKAGYLTVTATIQTLINMFEFPPPRASRNELIRNRAHIMTNVAIYIRAFDDELANVFDRDAKV
jgi:hypothetical protein